MNKPECPLCEPIGGSGRVPKRLDLAWICDGCMNRLNDAFHSPREAIRGEPVASPRTADLVRGAF